MSNPEVIYLAPKRAIRTSAVSRWVIPTCSEVGGNISIYWASPIYRHKPDPISGNFDVAADIGIWICTHVPGLHHYSSPPDWIYNHMSIGPGMLALALRLHWLCAYLFMLNGTVYFAGLVMGGGWHSLLPRRTDLFNAFGMLRYYLGLPLAKLIRRKWLHPRFSTKYNALQRAAYFSVPVAGCLSVATGEYLSRYSESDDPVLRAGANYAAGLRRRMECDRLVGWIEIR